MTSQYDIESSITAVNKLIKYHDELIALKADKKAIVKARKKIQELNNKLGKWCNDFDSRIKPFDYVEGCLKPDKIFVVRVPTQIKDHSKHIKQYGEFIYKEGYKVVTMEKQKGYISIVYNFYCEKK